MSSIISGWVRTSTSVQFFRLHGWWAKRLPAKILLVELVRVDQRPHRAVEDHDPPGQDLFELVPGARLPFVAIGNQSPDRKVTRHSRAAKIGKTGE